METFISSLSKLGLTQSQSRVYVALLGVKEAGAQEIVESVHENRTTVYMILNRLEELGLITKTAGVRTTFQAENPSKLKNLLISRQQELKEAQTNLANILSALNKIYVISHQKPGVVYLEGVDGLRLVYDEIIERRNDFLILPSKNARSNQEMDELIERNIKLQKKYDVKARVIYPESLKNETDSNALEENNVYVRFFGKELHHSAQTLIYGNSVAITSFDDGIFTTLITNEAVASTQRGHFESMWQAAIS